jgi:mandelamide amidase
MCTFDTPTSIGTQILAAFKPERDAAVVAKLRTAGAILFGKNNLVEMSYGLTGTNEHHGQVKNPHNKTRVTGGSSSGAGASVAARLIPVALGGDTVGSIRVPASLCGIVGFRPTTGRWPGSGIAPISHTFDTPGPMARSVEDCALLDAVVAAGPLPGAAKRPGSLEGLRFGYAPRQHLDLIDGDVERTLHETMAKLKASGAEIVEIDLGDDFAALAERANWPIFFHETMPHVTAYLKEIGAPATFQEIYERLGSDVKPFWTAAVIAEGPDYVPEASYQESLRVHRPALQKRYAEAYRSNSIDALLFPTTPVIAPPLNTAADIVIAGRTVSVLNLAKNVFPSSCAGLPGITMPMGLAPDGMPMGLEMDGRPGEDGKLLGLAARVSAILGPVPSLRSV